MLRALFILAASQLIVACAQKPVISDEMMRLDGPMPADFSGSWERDYTRGDDFNTALRDAYYGLRRNPTNGQIGNDQRTSYGSAAVSQRHWDSIYAIARLADVITRPQVLTISQSEREISVAREDDYAIFCAFYEGVAKNTASDFGAEVCGWDGQQLVSHMTLPDGLQVTHRLTVAQNGKNLRVVTTVRSSTAPVPFTLSRFYKKFEAPSSDFNCVETLSMRRVCSTGNLEL